jgi:SnoaL-like domain
MTSYPPIIDKTPFEDIIIAVWYDIDVADSKNVQYYFTPDARIYFGDRVVVGREAIHEGYQQRIARGPRLSRHVISNVFVTRADESSAETTCCVRLYAGDGTAPLPNPEPISVADPPSRFVRGEDGTWLIAERRLTNLFFHPETVFAEPPSK